jgi:hypothetical protein
VTTDAARCEQIQPALACGGYTADNTDGGDLSFQTRSAARGHRRRRAT